MERRDLHRLFVLLKALLEAITATGNKTLEAISKNTEAANEVAEKCPSDQLCRITVDLQIPREETTRYYAEQNKSHTLQWWTFWATFATFIAVAAYAVITYRQWRTMDAANTQTASLFKLSNRPWVGTNGTVSFEDPGVSWVGKKPAPSIYVNTRRVLYHIKNFGNSPALNVLLVAQPLTFSQAGSDRAQIEATVEKACQIADERTAKYGGDLLLPTGEQVVPFQFGNLDPQRFLFVLGCIVYRDIDGGIHHTRICHASALFLTPEPKNLESCQTQSAN